MSDQKKYDKIEDAITELPEGEIRENALNFAAHLYDNQLTPKMSDWGKFTHNGYHHGHMWIEEKNKWVFEIFDNLHFGDFHDEDGAFTKAVHDHVSIYASPCHDEC